MSYLPSAYYGQPQQAYSPPVGPPPATAEEIEQYDKTKRKSNILILIVVAMVVLLIALLIAVFVVAIRPKSETVANSNPVPSAMKIEFVARSTNTDFQSPLDDPKSSAYQSLASATCSQLEGIIKTKGYIIGGCTVSSMRQSSTSGTEMITYITVLNDGTKSDSELLLGVGSTLVAGVEPPLEIITNSIRRVVEK